MGVFVIGFSTIFSLSYRARKKEEGRKKKEEGRRKKEEGRRKKEEAIKSMVCGINNVNHHRG
jgi:hypothetical protein